MSWLRIDDRFAMDPKVYGLSDGALRLHLSALCHCAQHETDGIIAAHMVPSLTIHDDKAPLVDELVRAGLWEPIVGGFQVHNYLKWNPSHASLEAARSGKRERQTKYRARRSDDPGDALATRRSGVAGDGMGWESLSGSESEVRSDLPTQVRRPGESVRRLALAPPAPLGGPEVGLESIYDHPVESQADEEPEARPGGAQALESSYDLVRRVWVELWGAKYKSAYMFSPRPGPESDDKVIQRVGQLALEQDDPELYARHWISSYLREHGHRGFLDEHRHPVRCFERDIPKYGHPRRRPAESETRQRAAPEAEQPPAVSAQRQAELAARIAGIGRR